MGGGFSHVAAPAAGGVPLEGASSSPNETPNETEKPMKTSTILVLAAALAAGAVRTAHAASNADGFLAGFRSALETSKPLVVYLYQPRDADCERMERESLGAMNRFDAVYVALNATTDDTGGNVANLLRTQDVRAFPAVLVFRAEPGRVVRIGRIDGFVQRSAFDATMASILGVPASKEEPAEPKTPRTESAAAGDPYAALEADLRACGYDIKVLRNGTDTFFDLSVPRHGRTWYVTITLSKNAQHCWFMAPLGTKDKYLRSGADLGRFLEKNFEIFPARFAITGGSLYLIRTIERTAADRTALTAEIDSIIRNMLDTQDLWDIR
jgi:hypothetical protein